MDIVIATKNAYKVKEIREIFRHKNIFLYDLTAFPEIPEAVENGMSFTANARIKAKYYHQLIRLPVIADDSGLVVPFLNGEPGIYSSRYAGPDSDYTKNNRKLLEKLEHVPPGQRQAYFICCAVFWDSKVMLEAEGRIDGSIGFEAKGENGFGYDPLFLPDGSNKTFAELSSAEKNRISHRNQAFTRLREAVEASFAEINIDSQGNKF